LLALALTSRNGDGQTQMREQSAVNRAPEPGAPKIVKSVPIHAKQAVLAAKKHLTELMGGRPHNLTLEEVRIWLDKKCWSVTLSYLSGNIKAYKIFTIDAQTGEVTSMEVYAPRKS
jgi:hypothetical protein